MEMSISLNGRQPRLQEWLPRRTSTPTGLVILLHGGVSYSRVPMHRFGPAYLRMLLFARSLRRSGGKRGLAVWLLRNRFHGWNEPDLDAVTDARWALELAAERFPSVPVVLVGHSMGGRTALRIAGNAVVTAVAALAPWTPSEEPTAQLTGRTVLIVHGDRDRTVDADMSYQYSIRAKRSTDRICRFVVHGGGHAMLRREADWTTLIRRFVLSQLGLEPECEFLAKALAQPLPQGLNIPLSAKSASS